MKILGIDPGTITMGYGIIECNGDELTMVDYGAIHVNERFPIGDRLHLLHSHLLDVIAEHHPQEVAVEHPFVAKNVKTALAIGRAQAIAILAAAVNHLPVSEYSPAQIKQRVSSHGASGKEQVQHMVRLLLNLTAVPEPNDAADALAVAICHAQELHINGLLSTEGGR